MKLESCSYYIPHLSGLRACMDFALANHEKVGSKPAIMKQHIAVYEHF